MKPCSRRSSRVLAAIVAVVALAAAEIAPAFAADSQPKLQLKAEGLYYRAVGADVNFVQPVAGFTPSGTTDIQFGFKPGYRLEADYGRWRASWLDYAASYDASASCSAGICLMTANTITFIPIPTSGATADSQLRFQLLDAGYRAPLGDPDGEFSGGATFGLRHLELYDNAHVVYEPAPPIEASVHARDSLYGMRLGADAVVRPMPGWSLSALAAFSLLDGQAEGDGGSNNFIGNSITRRVNTMSTGYELSLQAQYAPSERFRWWIGYDFMQFQNLITAPGLMNTSGVPQAIQNFGLTGPRFGLSWSFN